MCVGSDDPCPLQVNGIIVLEAGRSIVGGVRVLKAKLIPVA
jgi:hypothetical protein